MGGSPSTPTPYFAIGGPLDGRVIVDERNGRDVPVQTGAGDDWTRAGFYRLTEGRWLWYPTWVEGD